MFQVLQFPRMSIGQTGESPKLHPECQVATLDVRSRDVARIGPSVLDAWDSSYYPARGSVPLRPGNVMARIQLDELREIAVRAKVLIHGRDVPAQPVRRKLESSLNSLAQVFYECLRVRAFASADVERKHHLGNAVERKPSVLIPPLRRCAGAKPSLVAADESPDFVSLHKLGAESAHLAIPESTAVLSRRFEQGKNRVFIYIRQARNGANAHTFEHHGKNLLYSLRRDVMVSDLAVRFAKCGFAGLTAPSLNFAPSVGSKPFAGLVLASDARHGFSPLDFGGKKPHTHLGSGVRLTPRFGLAPTPAETEAGALTTTDYLIGGGLLIGCLLSIRRPDANTSGRSYLRPKSFLLRRQRLFCFTDPLVSNRFSCRGFDRFYLPSLIQTLQNLVQGRKKLTFVLRQIVAPIFKFVANFNRSQLLCSTCFKHKSDCFSKSTNGCERLLGVRRKIDGIALVTKKRKTLYAFSLGFNSFFQIGHLLGKIVVMSFHRGKLHLCLFQQSFVFIGSHDRKIVA